MTTDLGALGQAIKRAQYRDHRAMDAVLRATGISLVQWDALRAIERAPGASANDLAVASFQTDQSFGALANRLEGAGWIERRQGSGRRIEHRLNEAGRAALETGREAVEGELPRLFGALDEGERTTLLGLLQRLTTGPDRTPET